MQKKQEENQKELTTKTDIGWGHQIRSYVLQPYQLVKDLRNKIESTNPTSVLDGNIDLFIEEGIKIKKIKMKKLLINLFLFTLFLFVSITVTLSTFGIETNKFNNLISEKASETKNIFLKLNTIKFKIDLRELSLFLETQYPEITYKNILIPIENAKVYIDFLSIFTTDTKIEKTKTLF